MSDREKPVLPRSKKSKEKDAKVKAKEAQRAPLEERAPLLQPPTVE